MTGPAPIVLGWRDGNEMAFILTISLTASSLKLDQEKKKGLIVNPTASRKAVITREGDLLQMKLLQRSQGVRPERTKVRKPRPFAL